MVICGCMQGLSQPKKELDLPDGVLTITLLRHQKIALCWMVQKEYTMHCLGGTLTDDQISASLVI
ncbi:hypothetical protein RND81_02G095100 [Saponaria officinalis]|uniref:Uncharacterized protein n=1 Tax=Saponaria officinalis TaxID=3572 RepID=A0AAW1MSL9_SAPOF